MSAAPTAGRRFGPSLRLFFDRPTAAIGSTIFLLFLLLALFGPLLAPYGENEQIYADARQAPSAEHWFGTDHLGRDVFSRVVLGARAILVLSGLRHAAGRPQRHRLRAAQRLPGGWAGRADHAPLRQPAGHAGAAAGPAAAGHAGAVDRDSVVIVIVVVYTPIVARVVRSVVLSVKSKGFVEAARLQGESLGRILFREILPSVLPALAVEGGAALLLRHLPGRLAGLPGRRRAAAQPQLGPDGQRGAADYVSQLPWALYFPAGAIAVLVIGVNLMADGLKRLLQAEQAS